MESQNKTKKIMMGNQAIVQGALDAGLQFASSYPGTPSSEIGIILSKIAKDNGVYFEYSSNEKVALEAVVGASFSGLKCLCSMKNFGMNVASDALLPFLYTGSKGPTVIMVADDPSCHSSAQSEENSRAFAYLAHIPTLEPADPQECYDFTRLAFELSEKFNLPIMLRTTTRVSHQRSIVKISQPQPKSQQEGKFVKDKNRFVTMPPRVMEMHSELLAKIEKIRALLEKSAINKVAGPKSKIGVIASGVAYLYVMEAFKDLQLDMPVLKIGGFYPLPEKKISQFVKPLKKVLVAEELEPYLEKEVARLAKEANPKLQILGKDILPEVGELSPDLVEIAIAKLAGKKYTQAKEPASKAIKHIPRFCTAPACPYWRMFAAVKQALPENETIFGGDIGCYMIAALKPTWLYDYVSCMASSLGIAHGVSKAVQGKQRVVAFMGDGTFFHSGIAPLINAVYNQSNPLFIVADNRITAMTGHQPNPGSGNSAMGAETIQLKVEEVARAIGVKNMAVFDPVEQFDELVACIRDFSQKPEVSLIVSRRICALLAKKQSK